MDMILLASVFEELSTSCPQQQIITTGTIYIIDNVIVLSDLVESSGYSSNQHVVKDVNTCQHMRLWYWGNYGISFISYFKLCIKFHISSFLLTFLRLSVLWWMLNAHLRPWMTLIAWLPPHQTAPSLGSDTWHSTSTRWTSRRQEPSLNEHSRPSISGNISIYS